MSAILSEANKRARRPSQPHTWFGSGPFHHTMHSSGAAVSIESRAPGSREARPCLAFWAPSRARTCRRVARAWNGCECSRAVCSGAAAVGASAQQGAPLHATVVICRGPRFIAPHWVECCAFGACAAVRHDSPTSKHAPGHLASGSGSSTGLYEARHRVNQQEARYRRFPKGARTYISTLFGCFVDEIGLLQARNALRLGTSSGNGANRCQTRLLAPTWTHKCPVGAVRLDGSRATSAPNICKFRIPAPSLKVGHREDAVILER